MTIKEIAKLAGVSTATVSRALNGQPGVLPEKQQYILQLAKDLNYQPNVLAKGLSSKKSYTLGVAISDITNPFYGEIVRGIEEIATPHDYTTVLFSTDYDIDKERRALNFLQSGRIDGLIASVSNYVVDECVSLEQSGLPLVLLGQMHNEAKCGKVGCNNVSSAYQATEYLIKKGHKNIAHVAGHRRTKTGMQRLEGFRSAMANYDLPVPPENIIYTDYLEVDAYEKVLAYLKTKPGITAMFVANDYLAIGCYKAIEEMGLKIPDDISVIGHDDIYLSTILNPELTTMHQQPRKVGRLASQLIFEETEKTRNEEKMLIVPTELVERASVRDLNLK